MSCTFCKSSVVQKKIKTYKGINYNICGKCGCHYQNPIIKTDYISDAYWTCETDPDGNKRRLIDERELRIKNLFGDSVSFVNKFENIDILDYGCGLGFFLSALTNKINKFGIEKSHYAKNYIEKNFPDINILQGGEQELQTSEKKFDIIFCHHVIEHVDDPLKLFELLKSKLKKKGILILATPIVNSFLSNYFGGNFRHYIPGHITLFPLKCLKNLLFENSFKILKIEKPYFKTDYFTFANVMRLFNPKKLSPPYRGSIMTIYAQLKN